MVSKQKTIRLFLDTNVLVSATLSDRGPSYKLLMCCLQNRLTIMISELVQAETIRNLLLKGENKVERYKEIMQLIKEQTRLMIIADPLVKDVETVGHLINKKDAPILTTAIKNHPDYLITNNRRHFIKPKVQAVCPFKIMTPDWFLRKVLKIKNSRE